MGLDITVKKLLPLGNRNRDEINVDDIFVLNNETSELSKFRDKFCFMKENSYYNLEGDLNKKGYNIEQLEWRGEEYGENVTFRYHNKLHPLYEVYKWLDTIWSKTYFDSKWLLYQSEYYKHFIDNFVKICEDNGWKRKYKFYASGNKKTYWTLVNIWKFCEKKISVKLINPSTIRKMDDCINYMEVGYQRKGANKLFYEDRRLDNIWCITTKDELIDHWEKYFSETEQLKKDFKESIIDRFIENETFVTYSW